LYCLHMCPSVQNKHSLDYHFRV